METVKEKRKKLTKLIEKGHGYYYSEEYKGSNAYEAIADYLIQNGATIQEWVSVDEPPKEDGRYLVFCELEGENGMVDALYEKDRGKFGDYAWYWSEARGDYKVWVEFEQVTHWMPLPAVPQPPKGVQ